MANQLTKKELTVGVEKIHRSTKVFWNPLAILHNKLRSRFRWYYRWHVFRFSRFAHLIIFVIALTTLFFLIFLTYKTIEDFKNREYIYSIAGRKAFELNQKVANLEFKTGELVLQKEGSGYKMVGILQKKIDMNGPVIWKSISWQADLPPKTQIQFRVRCSKNDLSEEERDNLPWSNPFVNCGSQIIYENKLFPESRYLEIEIYLEGNGENTPSLTKVDLCYNLPAKPGQVTGWVQDKLRRYVPALIEKIWHFFERQEKDGR